MPRSFLPALRSCFALPKQSPYSKTIDQGYEPFIFGHFSHFLMPILTVNLNLKHFFRKRIALMRESGLLDYWLRRYTDKIQLQVNRCKHLYSTTNCQSQTEIRLQNH